MIKKIIVPIFLLMTVNVLLAQRFDAGILAGFNGTQVEGDTYKGYNKPGIVAGIFVQTDVAPAIFAAMEIKYSQKGARNKITPKNPEQYIMRLGYIDVPVYVAFRTNDRGAVVAGLSTGYLIHSKESDNYGDLAPQDQHAFNNLDLQPFIGFQFDFLERLKVDLRMALSVLPIRGKPGVDTFYYWQNNQFNNVITLAAYYQLGR